MKPPRLPFVLPTAVVPRTAVHPALRATAVLPLPRAAWLSAALFSVALCAALLTGCKDKPGPAVAPAKAPVTQPPPATQLPPATGRTVTDTWLGKWTGPEGTWLTLENRDNGKYLITIQSLDSLATYEGTPAGYRIKFERSGQPASIRAGTGKDTGMKYLLDKTTCLYIQEGEGFCKD